ncbi:MAG: hypothetical protein ACLQVF_34945 [Isosphaeraceae bacterium]
MLWRHHCLVRACLASGLVVGLMFIGGSFAAAQTKDTTAFAPEPSAPPVDVPTATVDLLEAGRAGDLNVVAKGQGQDRVHLTLHNRSTRRLNVVIPPGLVAASAVGQGGAGGGRGGGFQSMGLGSVSNREGAFGEFRGTDAPPPGLQSIAATEAAFSRHVAVPVGETIELSIPAVCLNYGVTSPTPRDTFKLMDVADYSISPRVRKALRSLATYGTSQGVAQAVMWHVCNDLSFDEMALQAGKVMNLQQVALAARFVAELDASGTEELVDAAALSRNRIFVQVLGEGPLGADARRLSRQLDGVLLLGMPIQLVDSDQPPASGAPSLYLRVILTDSKTGETSGRILASSCSEPNAWLPLGKAAFRDPSSVAVLDGAGLARAIDRAVAGAFVTVKPARRSVGSTTLRVENRLPFTVTGLTVKAGTSSGSPAVPFQGVGVGPNRWVLLPIQAATASLVERVEANGL